MPRHAAARRNPTARGSSSRISIACALIVSSSTTVRPTAAAVNELPVVAAFSIRSQPFSSPQTYQTPLVLPEPRQTACR